MQGNQPPSFNPDVFSAELAPTFDDFWAQEAKMNWRIEEATPEDKQEYFEREVRFGTAVIVGCIALAAAHDGPVTVLLDIDETIGHLKYNDEEPRMVIRPAFPLVATELERLLGESLNIGLLTGRGQSHLDKELSNPTTLKTVISAVNPELVISAKEDGVLADKIAGENFNERKKRIDKILDWGPQGYVETYDTTTTRKGYMLQVCTEMYPDTAFMVVDDHLWANDLNPDNPQVTGIYVDPQMLFVI